MAVSVSGDHCLWRPMIRHRRFRADGREKQRIVERHSALKFGVMPTRESEAMESYLVYQAMVTKRLFCS